MLKYISRTFSRTR